MEQKEQKAYPVNVEVSDKAVFWADGDCMNSPDAPIRLRNGQRLSVHKYDGVFHPYGDIEAIRGKVCVFQYITQGKRFFAVKEVVGIDELTNSLRLQYYYPEKTAVFLDIASIEQVYIVDGIAE
jgi:hypothetical protein